MESIDNQNITEEERRKNQVILCKTLLKTKNNALSEMQYEYDNNPRIKEIFTKLESKKVVDSK
ncbi:MAG: hypothetical protein ABIX01_21430 [Chitinophagaceae bacterium]